MTLSRIYIQTPSQSEQKFQVCHQKYQLKKDTEQLEIREEFMTYLCNLSDTLRVFKNIPVSSSSSSCILFYLLHRSSSLRSLPTRAVL